MIKINEIKIKQTDSRVRIQSEVRYDDINESELIWFETDKKYSSFLTTAADPWLTCLTPLAFKLGQQLTIGHCVDGGLLKNMKSAMDILKQWHPSREIISIKAEPCKEAVKIKKDKTAVFFTAGVDSFYTLLKDYEKENNIEYLIFVIGFEIPVKNENAVFEMTGRLKDIAGRLKKELIVISTNLNETRFNSLNWPAYYGFALASAAQVLQNVYSKVLIATNAETENYKTRLWGDDPVLTPFYSSRSQSFNVDSLGVTRFEKIKYISGFDNALKNLKVCNKSQLNDNCGKCEKCYRTMVSLFLLGKLQEFNTSEISAFDIKKVQNIYFKKKSTIPWWIEIRGNAENSGQKDLVKSIDKSIRRTLIIKKFYSIILVKLKRRRMFRKTVHGLEKMLMRNKID
jgi:hypothetical protein